MTSEKSYINALEKLKQSYKKRLVENVIELKVLLEKIEHENLSSTEYESMRFKVHSLAGTGTTFGFPEISAVSRELDQLLTHNNKDWPLLKQKMQALISSCQKDDGNISNLLHSDISAKSQKPHVLIIDDDEELAEFLRIKLSDIGITITIASDGYKAFEYLEQSIPDLIILDIMMPHLNGHQVLEKLKNNKKYNPIPVVMLTSRRDQPDIARAFDKGIVDYFIKPIKPERLMLKIEEILNASQKTILLIEHDLLLLELLAQTYKENGYKILTARRGVEAWNIILETSVHLIVLDWTLPNSDALNILKNLRQNQNTKNIPFIVLATPEDSIEESINHTDRLLKPFIPKDLLKRSSTLLES